MSAKAEKRKTRKRAREAGSRLLSERASRMFHAAEENSWVIHVDNNHMCVASQTTGGHTPAGFAELLWSAAGLDEVAPLKLETLIEMHAGWARLLLNHFGLHGIAFAPRVIDPNLNDIELDAFFSHFGPSARFYSAMSSNWFGLDTPRPSEDGKIRMGTSWGGNHLRPSTMEFVLVVHDGETIGFYVIEDED